jgi:hypothetical protein
MVNISYNMVNMCILAIVDYQMFTVKQLSSSRFESTAVILKKIKLPCVILK